MKAFSIAAGLVSGLAGISQSTLAEEMPAGVIASRTSPDGSGFTKTVVANGGEILLATESGGIWRWELTENSLNELRSSTLPAVAVSNLLKNTDGLIITRAGRDLAFREDSVEGRWEKVVLPAFSQVVIAPRGDQLAAIGTEPPIVFLDPRTGKQAHRVDRQVAVDELRYSPSGRFLATSRYDRLYLWNAKTGEMLWKARLEVNLQGFAFTPDETTIFALIENEGLWAIDVASGNLAKRFHFEGTQDREEAYRRRLAISPDATMLAESRPGKGIAIWETFTGRQILWLGKHPGDITDLQFLPDGFRIVSVDAQGHAFVWDLAAAEFADAFDVTQPYSKEELSQLWRMLGDSRGHAMWSAMVALKHRPRDAMALIENPPNDELRIQDLIEQLDHDQFTIRRAAYQGLRELSIKAEPLLKKTLSKSRSAEVKSRIRRLLNYVSGPNREAQLLALQNARLHRDLRVIQLLKWVGTPAAIEHLQKIRDSEELPEIQIQAAVAVQWLEKKNARDDSAKAAELGPRGN